MHDLIFVSMENWDEVWRRNQFLCSTLARRFPEIKILFVGLQRHVANCIRSRDFDELFRKVTWTVPEFPNITVTRALRFAPDSWVWGRRCNEVVMRSHVQRVARQLGIRAPLLWLNPHYAVHMAARMGEIGVVYDITDDWVQFPQPAKLTRLIEAQDRELCRKADLVIVCSEALEERRSPLSRRLLLLPNGVDPDHYRAVCDSSQREQRQWNAPVFGYTGTIHPARVDVDLVIATARAFPQGSIVLVGPNHLTPELQKRIEAEPNIYLPGPTPYAELPSKMAQFNVCIVPHLETEFTESLNPLKLWEYLAAGKPIVSTNVAGFRSYDSLCHIASGQEAFVAACRDALTEMAELRTARRAVAAQHSWASRVDCLLSTLESLRLA